MLRKSKFWSVVLREGGGRRKVVSVKCGFDFILFFTLPTPCNLQLENVVTLKPPQTFLRQNANSSFFVTLKTKGKGGSVGLILIVLSIRRGQSISKSNWYSTFLALNEVLDCSDLPQTALKAFLQHFLILLNCEQSAKLFRSIVTKLSLLKFCRADKNNRISLHWRWRASVISLFDWMDHGRGRGGWDVFGGVAFHGTWRNTNSPALLHSLSLVVPN